MNTLQEIIDKYKADITKLLGTEKWELKCAQPEEKGSYSHYVIGIPFGCYELIAERLPDDEMVKYGSTHKLVSKFKIKGMYGCCGVAISYHAQMYSDRHKGLGTLLQKMRMDIARENGYTVLLCTDVDDNEPQKKILAKNGWTKIFSFTNKRTHNVVNMHAINLLEVKT